MNLYKYVPIFLHRCFKKPKQTYIYHSYCLITCFFFCFFFLKSRKIVLLGIIIVMKDTN